MSPDRPGIAFGLKKASISIPISAEMLAFHGPDRRTPEQQAEDERRHQVRKKREAKFEADLAAITDPLSRLVLNLHAKKNYDECDGCDPGSYAESAAEWPCATVDLIARHHGIEKP